MTNFVLVHLYKFTVALIVVLSLIAWWLVPAPAPAKVTPATLADRWELPSFTLSATARAASGVDTATLWGTVQAVADIPLNDPEWHFSGVTQNGQEKSVMISVAGQPLQTLKAGEYLPGGAKILRVDDDHLSLLINGKKRKLDLFQ